MTEDEDEHSLVGTRLDLCAWTIVSKLAAKRRAGRKAATNSVGAMRLGLTSRNRTTSPANDGADAAEAEKNEKPGGKPMMRDE